MSDFEMTDGAGGAVSPEKAAEAVRCFADLWGSARFDCGPQDYEYMVEKILAAL